MLKLGLVEGGNDLGDGEWDGEQATEHALDEEVSTFFLLNTFHFFLELGESHGLASFTLTIIAFFFEVTASHKVDPTLNDRLNEADGLCDDDYPDDVVEADKVTEHGHDLERGIEGLAQSVGLHALVRL